MNVEDDEPEITINGMKLTMAQAMTVRVAVETFAMTLANGLGDDKVGRSIAENYLSRIGEIRGSMYKPR